MRKIFFAAALFLMLINFFAPLAYAQPGPRQLPAPTANPPASTSQAQKVTCGADGKGINTAIGCIPVGDTDAFIGFILRWAIGIGGGVAFLFILYAGFMIMSSSGDPERLKAGQELMTSAIAGLIMLIFSVFILRVIGVDILGLPIED